MAVRVPAKLRQLLALCEGHLAQGVVYLGFEPPAATIPGGGFCQFCRLCLEHPVLADYCRRTIHGSSYQAMSTGEPYYFRCWAGLNSFVLPVLRRGRLTGAIEFGGFFFPASAEEDAAFVRGALPALDRGTRGRLELAVARIGTLSPADVRGCADFVQESLQTCGITDAAATRRQHEKYLLQRRIAEQMQHYGTRHATETDVFDLLAVLVAAWRQRDRQQVLVLLDDFFTRVMLQSSLKPELAKAQVHLLMAALTREMVVSGQAPDLQTALARQAPLLRELESLDDITDICYWAFRQVERLLARTEDAGVSVPRLHERVSEWLRLNYRRKVTLAQAARDLGASPSTIVKALRRTTGKSFHRQLMDVRIGEAKSLLAAGDLTLDAIARQCGFADQSHFTRSFHREVNLTPRKFRQMLTWVDESLKTGKA